MLPPAVPATDTATDTTTPASFWWLVGVSVLLALIPTAWPALDLGAASLFFDGTPASPSSQWFWVEFINLYAPAIFRGMLVLALVGWLIATFTPKWKTWRLLLAFLVLAGTLGPGAVVNLVFKDNWNRARPYQVENFGGQSQFTRAGVITDQCDANCSFVSGHVACGIFWASLLLLRRRQTVLWISTGVVSGLLIGFARMSDRAHFLSDVLWAWPITLMTSWLVWKLLVYLYRKPPAATGAAST